MYTDSLCSLQLIPRMQGIGFTFNCGAQCSLTSYLLNEQCVDLINELGLQQYCSQTECSPRVYNLSACITPETGITIRDTLIQTTVRDSVINDLTTGQSQASTPTTVYRTETTSRTDGQNISCTSKPFSGKEAQHHAVIGALVGLVMVLVVMAIIPWIWICWRFKLKGGLQRDKQQARYRKQP